MTLHKDELIEMWETQEFKSSTHLNRRCLRSTRLSRALVPICRYRKAEFWLLLV